MNDAPDSAIICVSVCADLAPTPSLSPAGYERDRCPIRKKKRREKHNYYLSTKNYMLRIGRRYAWEMEKK